jgi:hypothetical protein
MKNTANQLLSLIEEQTLILFFERTDDNTIIANVRNAIVLLNKKIIIIIKRNYYLCVIFITRFTDVVSNEDCGWIVKPPFIKNRKPFFNTKSVDKMCEYSYNWWAFKSEFAMVYPYIMIQPCLSNKREYKVITIPSQNITYLANVKGKGNAYSVAPHERILNFAMETVQYFKSRCSHAITHHPLFRVDILLTRDNK